MLMMETDTSLDNMGEMNWKLAGRSVFYIKKNNSLPIVHLNNKMEDSILHHYFKE